MKRKKQMIRWIKEFIINTVTDELVVGGHCGLCGKWLDKDIVHRAYRLTVCPRCKGEEND
jgi:hypothetical protein